MSKSEEKAGGDVADGPSEKLIMRLIKELDPLVGPLRGLIEAARVAVANHAASVRRLADAASLAAMVAYDKEHGGPADVVVVGRLRARVERDSAREGKLRDIEDARDRVPPPGGLGPPPT